jgi:DNA mismatch repair protein MutL
MPDRFNRIQVLPDTLINQIAAGEVIERPAAVLKELIENSLDAGARRIDVEVEEGGVRLIRVRDDGGGIEPGDLKLALRRHATSKIRSFADLERVMSLGFRGEALPSIGSVSKLTLTSRTPGNEAGWMVRMEGQSQITELEPAPHPVGTTVEVRDLFFNVPARRKFLRSERTEYLQILELMRRMALCHQEVGFCLAHQHRQVLNLKANVQTASPQPRLQALCGADFVKDSIELASSVDGVRISGWVGRPGDAGHREDIQYLYLNGRVIRDKTIAHALRRAYEGLLPEGRLPAYVLYLEMDPAEVDVNVHPSKSEVRFRDNRRVHDLVYSVVHRALTGPDPVQPEPTALPGGQSYILKRNSTGRSTPAVRDLWGVYASPRQAAVASVEAAEISPATGPMLGHCLGGPVLGKYLLAENAHGLVIVDIHAAWRCLLEMRFKSARTGGAVRSRPLLIPETVSLPEGKAEQVLNIARLLSTFGFHIEAAGPGTLMLRQVPALMREVRWAELIQDIAGVLGTELDQRLEGTLIEILARRGAEGYSHPQTPDAREGFLRELEGALGDEGLMKAGICRQLGREDLASLLKTGLRT